MKPIVVGKFFCICSIYEQYSFFFRILFRFDFRILLRHNTLIFNCDEYIDFLFLKPILTQNFFLKLHFFH